MAFAMGNEEEDELTKEGEAKTIGAESAVVTGDQQKATGTQNGTGNYTNLQSYIEQNKPAQFGEQFAGRVGESVTSAEQGQSAADAGFRKKSDDNSVQENSAIVKEATDNPNQVVNDANKLAQFRTQQNANYGGPKNLSDEEELYSKAYNPTNRAQSESKQAQTASGQKALLGQYYGGNAGRYNYSGGEKNLDQILIGMDPNSRSQLQQQQKRAGKAGDSFNTLQTELNKYATGKESETNKAREGVATALGGAIPAWQKTVTDRVGGQLKGRDEQVARINAAMRNRQGESLTEEDRAMLGVDLNQPLYNVGKGADYNWANPNLDANLQTLATPEEYQRSRDYSTLANQPDTFLTGKSGTGALVSKGSTIANDQANAAATWNRIRGGGGVGDDMAKWNASTGANNPWVAGDSQGYNIFDPEDSRQIENLIANQRWSPQVSQAVEDRRNALTNKYGSLDFALKSAADANKNAKKASGRS